MERRCVKLWSGHPKKSRPNFTILIISIHPWLFFISLFQTLSQLKFSSLGYPSDIENFFLSFFYSKSGQFDRAECADYEYRLNFKNSSDNKEHLNHFLRALKTSFWRERIQKFYLYSIKIRSFDAEFFSLSESIKTSRIFISFLIDERRIPLQLGHIVINNDFSDFMKLYFISAYQRDFFTLYVVSYPLSNETILNLKYNV